MKNWSTVRHRLLKAGVDFHGHLGPYLVLGMRMGLKARKTLKPRGLHQLSATVWTRRSPPQSCILDGIQVSSGCTMGKRRIRLIESRATKVRFRNGTRCVQIEPSEKAVTILSQVNGRTRRSQLEEIALALYGMSDRELLNISFPVKST